MQEISHESQPGYREQRRVVQNVQRYGRYKGKLLLEGYMVIKDCMVVYTVV